MVTEVKLHFKLLSLLKGPFGGNTTFWVRTKRGETDSCLFSTWIFLLYIWAPCQTLSRFNVLHVTHVWRMHAAWIRYLSLILFFSFNITRILRPLTEMATVGNAVNNLNQTLKKWLRHQMIPWRLYSISTPESSKVKLVTVSCFIINKIKSRKEGKLVPVSRFVIHTFLLNQNAWSPASHYHTIMTICLGLRVYKTSTLPFIPCWKTWCAKIAHWLR